MKDDRLRVQIAASFVTRHERSSVLTDHVSPRGVFVRTDSPPRAMSLLRIRFALPPEGTIVEMHGMVSRVEEPMRGNAVYGVEIAFFAKGGSAGRAWDNFLAHVRERHPEAAARPVLLARDGMSVGPPVSAPQSTAPRGAFAPALLSELASGGGFFLPMSESFSLGSDLRVTLTSPGSGASFTLDCVVRRRVFGSHGGIGIELTNMTAQGRTELESFLRAAKGDEPFRVDAREVHAPRLPTVMSTLAGPCSEGLVRFEAPEDSWASLDEGWFTPGQ